MRKFIIKASKQITLPVTPESFEVSYGRRTETVNIHEVGDVNLPGGLALGTIKISCMFPAQDYPFSLDSGDPYNYVSSIKKIITKKKPVRFIVSGTGVNERVLIEDIAYGERDGTGDVYATITMRGYRAVGAARTAAVLGASTVRSEVRSSVGLPNPYTAVRGDTLCSICRRAYGDGSYTLAKKLAKKNNRPDPNILYVGDVINLPPREALG